MRTGLASCSFMVITLSRFSGQETSECNGSAGSPQYGFITMQGAGGKDLSPAPVFYRPTDTNE